MASTISRGSGFIYNNKPDGGILFGTNGWESIGGLGVADSPGAWSVDAVDKDVVLRALSGGAINLVTATGDSTTMSNGYGCGSTFDAVLDSATPSGDLKMSMVCMNNATLCAVSIFWFETESECAVYKKELRAK